MRISKELKELDETGQWRPFYGVDCNSFRLGNIIFEAVEDEGDGYRSYLDTIEVVEDDRPRQFFTVAIAYVRVMPRDAIMSIYDTAHEFDGYQLIDRSGHVWLTVGTDMADDYYPTFTFRYTPKEPTKSKTPGRLNPGEC